MGKNQKPINSFFILKFHFQFRPLERDMSANYKKKKKKKRALCDHVVILTSSFIYPVSKIKHNLHFLLKISVDSQRIA